MVETGRFQAAMGQLNSTCTVPPGRRVNLQAATDEVRGVAVQAGFESKL